ncbi:hypothetical protein G7Z17_g11756 [Cylindrodendrum hubeiense]|uniref:BZIP domain-containing protein n=1 Tax=Cylindrodendrum hubeiense TaxID=595255 RepID=A0A9P5H3B4_9HYPO|nr:hypothetical protein G7Z17_g11756 [Cylindrodendrum hubeiense]
MPQNQTEATASRTSRLTENKRRFRARRKEYVADLERMLKEARERDVQATKEVQLAAQQVVQENSKLRELLGLSGFSDGDVDAWVNGGSGSRGNDESCARRRTCEQKASDCASNRIKVDAARGSSGYGHKTTYKASATQTPDIPEFNPATDTSLSIGDEGRGTLSPSSQDQPSPTPPTSIDSPWQSGEVCRPAASPSGNPLLVARPRPPCKLLSRLAENPSADLTQIFVAPAADELVPAAGGDAEGVECAKAYDMLMRFATSEERIDDVAEALESGCTSNGKGGCTVKKKDIWRVLDGMHGAEAVDRGVDADILLVCFSIHSASAILLGALFPANSLSRAFRRMAIPSRRYRWPENMELGSRLQTDPARGCQICGIPANTAMPRQTGGSAGSKRNPTITLQSAYPDAFGNMVVPNTAGGGQKGGNDCSTVQKS